jgi:hypothetical protein
MVRAIPALALIAFCIAAGPGPARQIRVGGSPYALLAKRGSLWVLTCDRGCRGEARHAVGRIVRIDPRNARVVTSGHLPRPHTIAVGSRGVYANDFWRDRIRLIDPRTLRVVRSLKLRLPFRFGPRDNAFLPFAVVVGRDAVWVATDRGALARADLRLGRVVSTVRLPFDAFGGMAVGPHALWLAESLAGVWRVDPRTSRVAARIRIKLRRGRFDATRVIPCGGKLLVLGVEARGGTLTNRYELARIDVRRNRGQLLTTVPEPRAVTCGDGVIWLAQRRRSILECINPRTGTVTARRRVRIGTALAYAGGRLWTAYPDGTVSQLGR